MVADAFRRSVGHPHPASSMTDQCNTCLYVDFSTELNFRASKSDFNKAKSASVTVIVEVLWRLELVDARLVAFEREWRRESGGGVSSGDAPRECLFVRIKKLKKKNDDYRGLHVAASSETSVFQ